MIKPPSECGVPRAPSHAFGHPTSSAGPHDLRNLCGRMRPRAQMAPPMRRHGWYAHRQGWNDLPAPLQQADQPWPSALPWLDREPCAAASAASGRAWSRGDEGRRGRRRETPYGSDVDRDTSAGVANQDMEPKPTRGICRAVSEVRARPDATTRVGRSLGTGIYAPDRLPNPRMTFTADRRLAPLTGRDERHRGGEKRSSALRLPLLALRLPGMEISSHRRDARRPRGGAGPKGCGRHSVPAPATTRRSSPPEARRRTEIAGRTPRR